MQLTDFRVLTFDCYGTLIDWETGIADALRPLLARMDRPPAREAALAAFARHESAQEAETPRMIYSDLLAAVHRRLAEEWRVAASDEDHRRFGAAVPDWPAFPDSAPSLQYLKQHYKLVILSNVDRASFSRSNEKLGVVFDRILTAQDIGSYKPSLRNFEYALGDLERTFGTKKGDILHTAQSIFHDVVPARSVGLATMWINRRKSVGGWGATPAPKAPGALTTPDIEVASMADFVVLHQAHLRGESA